MCVVELKENCSRSVSRAPAPRSGAFPCDAHLRSGVTDLPILTSNWCLQKVFATSLVSQLMLWRIFLWVVGLGETRGHRRAYAL